MASHSLTARFSDGAEISFSVESDTPILDAALANGVTLLHQCRAGSCGTCMCRRVSGDVAMRTTTSIALLPREIADGMLLTCLSTARSDAVLEFPYESALLDRAAPQRYQTEVLSVTPLSASVTELRLVIDADERDPVFEPGMFYLLHVPGSDVARPYSMASIPSDLPEMRFLIRQLPQGAISDYLAQRCAPGDPLTIEGPFGDFTLREESEPMIMVAGGTGLAPLLSMLDAIRERRRSRAKILLCFGVNRYEDLFCLDELELRREWMPQLELRIAIAESDPRWSGPVGVATDLLRDQDVTSVARAYLCGPPAMIEAASERLAASGLERANIHFERFSPAP
jgi:anthranilate 1,2-dioxygenase reductase component